MSELMNTASTTNTRWQLLTTVSALALLAVVSVHPAKAETDRPTIWFELGGQLERVSAKQELFEPLFIQNSIRAPLWKVTPANVQRAPRYSTGGEASIRFEPAASDWVISASLRYGRSNRKKEGQQQTLPPTLVPGSGLGGGGAVGLIPARLQVANQFVTKQNASYALADFKAGKDVGLGLFGGHATAAAGIRFAQFSSTSNTTLKSRPTLGEIKVKNIFGFNQAYYYPHVYQAAASDKRNFHGVGPTLSFEGAQTLAGKPDSMQFVFDWGVNAALLFGRQKANTQHETQASSFKMTATTKYNKQALYHTAKSDSRSRSVIVPNLGAVAGLSVAFPNAKLSFGYRADFFFGAMDGGIDTRKTADRIFHGPYAKIAVGL